MSKKDRRAKQIKQQHRVTTLVTQAVRYVFGEVIVGSEVACGFQALH